VRDVTGKRQPEAVVTECGTFYYGHAGIGFQLLSKQTDGR